MSVIEQRFDVGDRPLVDVRLPAGTVTVVGGAPGAVEVRLESREPERFVVEQVGDRILVRTVERPFGRWLVADVRVSVPPATAIEVRGASTDVTVDTAVQSLRSDLASGQVRARDVAGDVRVRSASGDFQADSVGGRLEAVTAAGEVRVLHVAGAASVTTASGQIALGRVDRDLSARSASGEVEVSHFAGSALDVTTISGAVRVQLPPGQLVDLDLGSLSGDVSHTFAPDGLDGGGQVRVRVKTVSGDIRLASVRAVEAGGA